MALEYATGGKRYASTYPYLSPVTNTLSQSSLGISRPNGSCILWCLFVGSHVAGQIPHLRSGQSFLFEFTNLYWIACLSSECTTSSFSCSLLAQHIWVNIYSKPWEQQLLWKVHAVCCEDINDTKHALIHFSSACSTFRQIANEKILFTSRLAHYSGGWCHCTRPTLVLERPNHLRRKLNIRNRNKIHLYVSSTRKAASELGEP